MSNDEGHPVIGFQSRFQRGELGRQVDGLGGQIESGDRNLECAHASVESRAPQRRESTQNVATQYPFRVLSICRSWTQLGVRFAIHQIGFISDYFVP